MARPLSLLLAAVVILAAVPASAVERPAPRPQDWADIAKLPDWSGVWAPDIRDQNQQARTNPPPWNADAAKTIAFQQAEERAGRPKGLFVDCLPEAMPSWMMITHNSFEALLTPGRVTLLGDSDGNRLRRIYTDGRPHPEDPDLSFHGHSTGRWENGALIVDTVGILPQSLIAISEAVGIANNGDMHIKEKFWLPQPNVMHVEMEITAPKVLTAPYKTTRIFNRQRDETYEILEGVCRQGDFEPGIDERGDAVFKPLKLEAGGNFPAAQ